MVFMPSGRVQNEMFREPASVWYVPVNGGGTAILVKAPTTALKAVMSGGALDLLFGVHPGPDADYLCTGARLGDSPDSPLIVCGVQREAEEHMALAETLIAGGAPCVLFNEMDVCVARSEATFTRDQAERVQALIGDPMCLYAGPFTERASHSLDCFCMSVDPSDVYEGAHACEVTALILHFEEWTPIQVAFVGNREAHVFRIDDPNEGETLEKALWSSLESVFPDSLHKNPQVAQQGKKRELTDVLCHYEYGVFLIEAKDLATLPDGWTRPLDRRVLSMQKQARKAIRQLVGAAKAVVRGDAILSSKGEPLVLNREMPPHCIVLLGEIIHSGDWSIVESEVFAAMKEVRGFVHIMDFRELISLLKASSGDPRLIDLNLMRRAEVFAECGSVHLRGVMPPAEEEDHEAV